MNSEGLDNEMDFGIAVKVNTPSAIQMVKNKHGGDAWFDKKADAEAAIEKLPQDREYVIVERKQGGGVLTEPDEELEEPEDAE